MDESKLSESSKQKYLADYEEQSELREFKDYDLKTNLTDLKVIDNLLKEHCNRLRPKWFNPTTNQYTFIHKVIQIGKQNGVPLLQNFVDAFNRYRLRRLKNSKRKMNVKLDSHEKFNDITEKKFINDKCKGIAEIGGDEFHDILSNSLQFFYQKMLYKPRLTVYDTKIDDSLVDIIYYIFESYEFIHEYSLSEEENLLHLPCQIDIAIIPKSIQNYQFTQSVSYQVSAIDEYDSDDDKDYALGFIGNIKSRLKSQMYIERLLQPKSTAIHKKMRNAMQSTINNKTHQRGIIVIDRRETKIHESKLKDIPTNVNLMENMTDNIKLIDIQDELLVYGYIRIYMMDLYQLHFPKALIDYCLLYLFEHCGILQSMDRMYVYQPDQSRNCHCFEKDKNKFINASLFQNSIKCILPSYKERHRGGRHQFENRDIGIISYEPHFLVLSFHILHKNQIKVYLSFNGWCTRFFIQDIKYFFPDLFIDAQEKILRKYWLGNEQDIGNRYDHCKKMCMDNSFEQFYEMLGFSHKSPH